MLQSMALPPDLLGNVGQLAGGLGGATALFFAGRWMRRLNVVGRALSMGGLFLTLLAVLAAVGVVDIDVSALADLLAGVRRLLAGAGVL